MIQEVLPLANPEKVHLAQENLIAYHRIFAAVPGVTFVDEAHCTWNMTAGGEAPGNQILRARFTPATADREIDALVRRVGQYGGHFDWTVFPSCQPDNLKQRVEAYGRAGGPDGQWQLHGKIGGLGGTWMLMDLADLPPQPQVPADFHIERVLDETMLETWRLASCHGFGGGPYRNFYTAYSRHGFSPEIAAQHYIGYLDKTPVTSGTLLLTPGMASIYNVSTPTAYRRRGFGTALTWFMFDQARERGHRDAFVWSSALGRHVYQGVGFTVYDFAMREYQWRKR
ncbi:MAG: GNAT family N-acetyltransferase [Candidatus Latescibacteria bacterium]|nr:GNAT family N-acetyltransferase [Candidatus Latescibacterota bacterium]